MESCRLKVCLFTNVPAPYRLPVFERLSEFVSLDVKFYEMSHDDRHWQPDLDQYTFDYEFLDGWYLGGVIRINPRISTRLRDEEYDIYIIGSGPSHISSATKIHYHAWKNNIPCIIWTECVDIRRRHESLRQLPTKLGRIGYDLFRRMQYYTSDGYIAYSGELTESFLQNRGVNSDDIFSGIQIMPESLLGSRRQVGHFEKFTILVVAYLRRPKGIQTLIRAFQRLNQSNLELIIAGDGSYRDKLESIARNDSRIEFKGYTAGTPKWKLYEHSDLFILPTFKDTWGLVVNEALYFGTPVITTDAAGASELVKQSGAGEIVESGDINALSKAIDRMIQDKEYYDRLVENAEDATMAWDIELGVRPFVDAINHVRSSVEDC